jgi:hypothetical protein
MPFFITSPVLGQCLAGVCQYFWCLQKLIWKLYVVVMMSAILVFPLTLTHKLTGLAEKYCVNLLHVNELCCVIVAGFVSPKNT